MKGRLVKKLYGVADTITLGFMEEFFFCLLIILVVVIVNICLHRNVFLIHNL